MDRPVVVAVAEYCITPAVQTAEFSSFGVGAPYTVPTAHGHTRLPLMLHRTTVSSLPLNPPPPIVPVVSDLQPHAPLISGLGRVISAGTNPDVLLRVIQDIAAFLPEPSYLNTDRTGASDEPHNDYVMTVLKAETAQCMAVLKRVHNDIAILRYNPTLATAHPLRAQSVPLVCIPQYYFVRCIYVVSISRS